MRKNPQTGDLGSNPGPGEDFLYKFVLLDYFFKIIVSLLILSIGNLAIYSIITNKKYINLWLNKRNNYFYLSIIILIFIAIPSLWLLYIIDKINIAGSNIKNCVLLYKCLKLKRTTYGIWS